MAFESPHADLFGPSTLLSRLDCSNSENAREAAHRLRRCSTEADFAAWAREWGANLVEFACDGDFSDREDWVSADDLKEVEADLTRETTRASDMEMAINKAVKALEKVAFDQAKPLADEPRRNRHCPGGLALNLTIERSAALPALQRITGIVQRRHTIEILANLALTASDAGLSIRGTDLDMEMIETVPAQVDGGGDITIPADKLFDIVRNSEAGSQVALKASSQTRMGISSGRSRFMVPTLPSDSFPRFPFEGFEGEFTMPAKTLADMLDRVSFMADRKAEDNHLSCVYLAAHGDLLHAVACCSEGVALRREPKPEGADLRAIIPMRVVAQVTKWLADSADDVTVAWVGYGADRADKLIRFTCGRTQLSAKLFDRAGYVEYMRALIEVQDLSALTDQDALSGAIRRVQVMQDSKSNAVRLKFCDGGVVVQARNDQAGEGQDEIAAEYEGPEAEFLIGTDRLSSAIGSMRGDQIEISFAPGYDDKNIASAKVIIRAPSDPAFVAMLMQRRA
jgi:DNA polymerase-3 subunit beta